MNKNTDNQYEEVKHVKLSIALPTLIEAKEICKKYKRIVNGGVLLINAVAPMVTKGGIILSKDAHKDAQNALNKKGMLVVLSPFKKNKIETDLDIPNNPNAVYEGEKVLYQPESPALFTFVHKSKELLDGLILKEGTEPTSEMYKTYIIIGIHSSYITLILK